MSDPKVLAIDEEWAREVMLQLLRTPSPTGRTDQIMHQLGEIIAELDIPFELTRRGALLATLPGRRRSPARAIVVHADTIGMAVRARKPNGRLRVVPIGTHSARFSEGARVTIFTDNPDVSYSGTILPLKASGHAYNEQVDTQGVGWEHVEIRVDEPVHSAEDLAALGIEVGDFVAHHALPEITPGGYVKSRHLDDKAGIAAALAAFKAVKESVAMQDMTGPFDYHLTRKLLTLCQQHGIEHRRDVFDHYRSDVAAAIEAGAETRAALIGFGTDATHGHERTTLQAIRSVAELTTLYLQSELTFEGWDRSRRGDLADFPTEDQPAPVQQTVAPVEEA
jgi:putative aminopeptidase FrvX